MSIFNKIISITYDKKSERKILTILGLKIKIGKDRSLFYPIIKLIKKIKLACQSFQFSKKNKQFINRVDKTIKRRLFLTTGNINLINSLAIIEQLKEENVEDVLFVFSHLKNEQFEQCQSEIAKLHGFKQIFTLFDNVVDLRHIFINNNLFDFDEIILSNQCQFINVVKKLYPSAEWIMTDEAASGAIARSYCNYDKVKNLIMHKYVDRIDYLGLSEENAKKVIPIDKEIFKKVSKKAENLFPIESEFKREEKPIIFCGTYWEDSGLSFEDFCKRQDEIMNNLINKGYKVFFKPHPRDNRIYNSNPNIKNLQTTLPLECYSLDNVIAVVSFYSFVSLHIYYFRNVPGFTVLTDDLEMANKMSRKMIEEYTAPISLLLDLNTDGLNFEEIKSQLQNKYKEFMKNKPLLSENKVLIEYAKAHNE